MPCECLCVCFFHLSFSISSPRLLFFNSDSYLFNACFHSHGQTYKHFGHLIVVQRILVCTVSTHVQTCERTRTRTFKIHLEAMFTNFKLNMKRNLSCQIQKVCTIGVNYIVEFAWKFGSIGIICWSVLCERREFSAFGSVRWITFSVGFASTTLTCCTLGRIISMRDGGRHFWTMQIVSWPQLFHSRNQKFY